MAFPELSETERGQLAVRSFEHFGMVAMDFVRADRRTDDEVVSSTEDNSQGRASEAMSLGKGVLGVGMHFGNWERSAHFSKILGYPCCAVARDADDPSLQAQVDELRRASGMEVLSRGNAARAMLGALREGRLVVLLVDQNADEAFVEFFGKPAGTTLGAAVLHLRTGAPIMLSFYPRIGPGRYRLIADEPLDFSAVEPKPSPEEIMQVIHRRFEEVIRLYPEQWLWLHDRWKSARRRGLL